MEPKDKANDKVFLVIGPWRHSGVNHYGMGLGPLAFTGDTALEFRVRYMKPFFDRYLKDAPDPHTPPVLTYATGINRWETSSHWPVGKPVRLYLHDGFKASFEAPAPRPATMTIMCLIRPSPCPSCHGRSTWRMEISGRPGWSATRGS